MLSWLTQHDKKNVDAMEQICLESDATSYKFSLLSFQFIISVVIIQFVLGYSRALSVALQVVDCDLIAAHDDARTVVRALENLREGTRYQQLYDIALHPIFRTGLLLSPFILLVRLGTTPPLAYPKDLFLGLFSIFCLLQILALFSHLRLSQVILMPMTFNPTNIAQHLGQLLQSELCPRPLMLSMPGCHLIACC